MSANPNSITVEAGKIERQYFADSWRYRELFAFLAWRDILVRYKQTAIGVAWAVLQPFLIMVVFSAVFGKLARFPSEGGAPYPIMVYAGMLPWQFFANCFRESASSLVANRNMVSKVYFPRLVLPFSSVAVSFVDFLISLVILAGLMVWYRFVPTWRIVYLPLFIVIAVIASFGPGLFIAALNVKYRDFKYVVPFIIQFGLYISPVGFSARVIPEKFRLLYSLNPMVGVIDGFRWAILGGESTIYLQGFLLSISIVVAICVLGFWYFRKKLCGRYLEQQANERHRNPHDGVVERRTACTEPSRSEPVEVQWRNVRAKMLDMVHFRHPSTPTLHHSKMIRCF
jgi:lipopolysaccharide transport system permease protein